MKKIKILGLLFFVGFNLIQAQVIIRPTAINNPFFKFEQLFKIQLVNTSNEVVEGVVQVRMEDNLSQTIFQINSLPIQLKQGQSLTAAQINWEQGLDIGNQQILSTLSQSGNMPNGQYSYCYRFVDGASGRSLGSHCQESTNLNYQKPALIFPQNADKISTLFPVLSWRPPLPIFGNELNYALRLVELETDQAPIAAIQSNLPLLEKYRLKTLSLPYPVTAIALKEGKQYAWQITAYWRETEIGKTEIWQFEVNKDTPIKTVAKPESYRLVKRQMGASFYVFTDQIYFAYDNRNGEQTLNYTIYPKDNPSEKIAPLPIVELNSGLNQIELSLDKKVKLDKDRAYLLQIEDKRGDTYYLGFKSVRKKALKRK